MRLLPSPTKLDNSQLTCPCTPGEEPNNRPKRSVSYSDRSSGRQTSTLSFTPIMSGDGLHAHPPVCSTLLDPPGLLGTILPKQKLPTPSYCAAFFPSVSRQLTSNFLPHPKAEHEDVPFQSAHSKSRRMTMPWPGHHPFLLLPQQYHPTAGPGHTVLARQYLSYI